MKIKTYLLELGKPSRNGTMYSREAVEGSMEGLIGKNVTIEFNGEPIGIVEDVDIEIYPEGRNFLTAIIKLDETMDIPDIQSLGNYSTSAIVDDLKTITINGEEVISPQDLDFEEVSAVSQHSQDVPDSEMYRD